MKLNFRVILLICFLVASGVIIVLRLMDIQLIQGSFFADQAQDNRFYSLPLDAERGVLEDRYGRPLVYNEVEYSLASDPNSLYSSLEPISRDEALMQLATNSAFVVKENARHFKFPVLSHVLGYVGEVTAEEIVENSDLKPHDKIGKMGLEKSFDRELRGVDGKQTYEISATLQRQRLVAEQPQISGQNIRTTLDPELSQAAYDALDGQKGVVIVSDAGSGEVLAMVSGPGFDNNIFRKKKTDEEGERDRRQQINGLFDNEDQPFFNRSIAGAYPPGSVFKLVTALAGLESGQINADTLVEDEGVLTVGETEFRSWYYWSHGRTEGDLNIVRALSRSNDIYFYKAAEWVGVEGLAQMAKNFGFGEYTNIEIGPESRGLIPDPAWKEQVIGEKWYLGNTYHMGIGQGDVLVSPLQVSQMVQTVANEGVLCRPHLINGEMRDCRGLGLQEENLELVLAGMLDACSSGGTAFPFFERNDELRVGDGGSFGEGEVRVDINNGAVACKTGTAEFGAADASGVRPTHGWLVAIVKPQFGRGAGDTEVRNEDEQGEIELESVDFQDNKKEAQNLNEGKRANFPDKITITVLVESDEEDSSKEGSYDASPVALEVLEFIEKNY